MMAQQLLLLLLVLGLTLVSATRIPRFEGLRQRQYHIGEYLDSPAMGIDVSQPRFSWVVAHLQRNQYQSAYQIRISTDPSVSQGDVWDSGKVSSSETSNIQLPASVTLQSDTSYFWMVYWWDANGNISPPSQVAQFYTAFLSSSDWSPSVWIGGANMLRTVFSTSSSASISRAMVYVCGLGYYQLTINGNPSGANYLDPAWTDFPSGSRYTTYDVTGLLSSNTENALGVLLGGGWWVQGLYNQPKMLRLKLTIQYADGGAQVVVSDSSWNVTQSPVVEDSIYNGSTYDARLEQEGWDTPQFTNGSSWTAASVFSNVNIPLRSAKMEPIQTLAYLSPKNVTALSAGELIFDLGQNFAGWCILDTLVAPAGTTVVIKHAEVLQKDGSLYTANLRSALATDTYIFRGDSDGESFEPLFTYHGFRFVSVSGVPSSSGSPSLLCKHVASATPLNGDWTSSNALLNQIQSNVLWGQSSNLMSVPTDCDQRDERLGWMADAHLSTEECLCNYRSAAFYTKFAGDLMANVGIDGNVSDVVPAVRYSQRPSDPAWGGAFVLIPYYVYKFYGDLQLVEWMYPQMQSYVAFLEEEALESGIGNMFTQFGDWVPPPPTPMPNGHFTAAWYYLLNVANLIELADAINHTEEANDYRAQLQRLTVAFNAAFFSAKNAQYASASLQTAYALPMWLGLVPPQSAAQVTANFLNQITGPDASHIRAGILGTKYVPFVLDWLNRTDLALTMALQATYPGWGYMITNPNEASATTLWELWDSDTGNPSMDSRNHIMFGSVSHWFYTTLAGIRQQPGTVGWDAVRIQSPDANILLQSPLSAVAAALDTPHGMIVSEWQRSGGMMCAEAAEGMPLVIDCGVGGGVIASIEFASLGAPQGDCAAPVTLSSCHHPSSKQVAESMCVGRSRCEFAPSWTEFGTFASQSTQCVGESVRRMRVLASCSSASPSLMMNVSLPLLPTASQVVVSKLGLSSVTILESSNPIWKNGQFVSGDDGITAAVDLGTAIQFTVSSGTYTFEVGSASEPEVVCAEAALNQSLHLACPAGKSISFIRFASFGNPIGDCATSASSSASFAYGACHAGSSKHIMEQECVGKKQCDVSVVEQRFGVLQCADLKERLVAEVICS